jgi:hypothetical protein
MAWESVTDWSDDDLARWLGEDSVNGGLDDLLIGLDSCGGGMATDGGDDPAKMDSD